MVYGIVMGIFFAKLGVTLRGSTSTAGSGVFCEGAAESGGEPKCFEVIAALACLTASRSSRVGYLEIYL